MRKLGRSGRPLQAAFECGRNVPARSFDALFRLHCLPGRRETHDNNPKRPWAACPCSPRSARELAVVLSKSPHWVARQPTYTRARA